MMMMIIIIIVLSSWHWSAWETAEKSGKVDLVNWTWEHGKRTKINNITWRELEASPDFSTVSQALLCHGDVSTRKYYHHHHHHHHQDFTKTLAVTPGAEQNIAIVATIIWRQWTAPIISPGWSVACGAERTRPVLISACSLRCIPSIAAHHLPCE